MDELSPHARALLASACGADDPVAGDLLRVRRAVLMRIGSAGFGATLFSLCLQRAKALVGAAPKLVTVVLVAAGGAATYQHAQHRLVEPASVPMVAAPKAAPASAALGNVAVPEASPAALAVAPISAPSQAPRAARPRAPQALAAPLPARSPADLEGEMRWVRGADAALRSGDVASAARFLEQHAREFPTGVLAEEREGLRLVAGCQGGSPDGARAAARFLEHAPHSLLAGRLRGACPQLDQLSGG